MGGRVAQAAKALGQPLMPWQQHVADVALEYDPDTGRLIYREINLAVPRQAGKTSLSLALMAHRCTRFGPRQTVTYLAQSRKSALAKWRDQHVPLLEASPFCSSFDVRKSNGSEAVMWRNGSLYAIDAPTETSGHGATIDLAILDEAWAHVDDRQEAALAPALITRQSAQLWVTSAAGNGRSRYWWAKINAGRASVDTPGATAYFEWSAPDDADPEDPATWWAAHPALGHTIDEASLAAELDRARRGEGIDLFRRAYLNQWPEIPAAEAQRVVVVPLEWWDALENETSRLVGERVFAVDMTPDRSTVAIVAVGDSSLGGVHVETVDHVADAGAEWLIGRLRDLSKRFPTRAVVAHLGGPIGSLGPVLERTFRDKFTAITDKEVLSASGSFYDAIRDGSLVHIGEPAIRSGLDGAVKAHSGDQWRWSRRGSHVDIAPLVAATIGWHVHTTAPVAMPAHHTYVGWH